MGIFSGLFKRDKRTKGQLKEALRVAYAQKRKLLNLEKDFNHVYKDLVALGRGMQMETDKLRKKFGGKIPVSEHRRLEKEVRRLFKQVQEITALGRLESRELSNIMKEGKMGEELKKDIKLQELINREDITINKILMRLLAFLRLGRDEVGSYNYDNTSPLLKFIKIITAKVKEELTQIDIEINDLAGKVEKMAA